MRVIDLETWPRKDHFLLFLGTEFPHVNLSIQVNITDLWKQRAQLGVSPTVAIVYVLAKGANSVPEFRQRIRGEGVIEHDVIHPLLPILCQTTSSGLSAAL